MGLKDLQASPSVMSVLFSSIWVRQASLVSPQALRRKKHNSKAMRQAYHSLGLPVNAISSALGSPLPMPLISGLLI